MSKKVRTFAGAMDNKNNNQQYSQIDWRLVLKVAIALLTALAGAIGVSKSEAVADLVNGIANTK